MNTPAPRSVDEYLRQLRAVLDGQDPALIQDALYDAEEYLRAEIAAHSDKSEADVLELIASTYGAPDEVASAVRLWCSLGIPLTITNDGVWYLMWARRLVGEAMSQSQAVIAEHDRLAELIIAGTGDLAGVALLIDRITAAHTERMKTLGLNP